MTNIILTTPSELERIIAQAIEKALQFMKPTEQDNSNLYMGIEEASALVSLSKNTVYGMVSRREIPHYKRGKKLYFLKEELQNWIGSEKVLSASEIKKQLDTNCIQVVGSKLSNKK
jgi:excisionase family DNA binding protein